MIERDLRGRGICDQRVIDAMAVVPRHRFVRIADINRAYDDCALPTEDDQTISQPYMVAAMTELLDIHPGHRVLEIGTGSGYQTAILAQLGAIIWTLEANVKLASSARKMLSELGFNNQVNCRVGDGTLGYPEASRYDRIIVTAGAPYVPNALRQQTKDPGRIVIPLGTPQQQHLCCCDHINGKWIDSQQFSCRFVPLTGEDGWAP